MSEIRLPQGLARLLERASTDEAFRARLLADREHVDVDGLSAREQAILRSMPTCQLELMIDRFAQLQVERRRFLGGAAASTVTLLGGVALSAWQLACDRQPERGPDWDNKHGATGGIRPDMPGGAMADYRKPHGPDPLKSPDPRPKPQCPRTVILGEFRTLSGPARAPGKVDLERLQDQIERICDAQDVDAKGKLSYEFTVEGDGAVTNVKVVESAVPEAFETLVRKQLERVVYFETGEPSRVGVIIELR